MFPFLTAFSGRSVVPVNFVDGFCSLLLLLNEWMHSPDSDDAPGKPSFRNLTRFGGGCSSIVTKIVVEERIKKESSKSTEVFRYDIFTIYLSHNF